VLGHPKTTPHEYASVKGLRKKIIDGVAVLEAFFCNVNPNFEQAVKAGRYKKRSASFSADGHLLHVGFLGALPPAVKGLSEVAFSEHISDCELEHNPAVVNALARYEKARDHHNMRQ